MRNSSEGTVSLLSLVDYEHGEEEQVPEDSTSEQINDEEQAEESPDAGVVQMEQEMNEIEATTEGRSRSFTN